MKGEKLSAGCWSRKASSRDEKSRPLRREKGAKPKFFQGDGDLNAIRSLSCIEVDVGGFLGWRHDVNVPCQLRDTRYHIVCESSSGGEGKLENNGKNI